MSDKKINVTRFREDDHLGDFLDSSEMKCVCCGRKGVVAAGPMPSDREAGAYFGVCTTCMSHGEQGRFDHLLTMQAEHHERKAREVRRLIGKLQIKGKVASLAEIYGYAAER